MFFDSHVHLNLRPLSDDIEAVVDRALEVGVDGMVVVGIDLPTSRSAAEIAARFPVCHATAGIHPHDAGSVGDADLTDLETLVSSGNFVAVGEAGLDYYRDRSPRDAQERIFRAQIRMAQEANLPIVIHMRDAHEDGMAILEEFAPVRGVMHCFGGDAAEAQQALALGLHVSFAGPLTYPKADGTREAAASVPLERTLIETDCPFLAPQPIRGKTNEPHAVRWVAEAQALLRGIEIDEVARRTGENARRLFGLGVGTADGHDEGGER